MMIRYSEDYNLKRIIPNSLLREFHSMPMDVHIFGLKDRPERAPIEIRSMEIIPSAVDHAIQNLLISISVTEHDEPEHDYDGIMIGLQRHVRQDVSVSRRIVRSLLLACAGRLQIDKAIRITRLAGTMPDATKLTKPSPAAAPVAAPIAAPTENNHV